MKYDGIVLISDMDGTLLDRDRKLSKENLDALREFTKNGGLFGVATGRMERAVLTCFPELPVNIPSIFYNGALIYEKAEDCRIRERLMPEGLEGFFQELLDRFPDLGMEINSNGKAYILRGSEILDFQLAREGLVGIQSAWKDTPQGWYKVLLTASHDRLAIVKDCIEKSERRGITVVFSEENLLDIMAKDISKGDALELLRGKYGWKKVVAVGDSENDISLLLAADLGIAVGNAQKSVKDAANRVIGPNSDPCIPQVLKILNEKFL